MTLVSTLLHHLLGGLMALPVAFVASYGWPGLAVLGAAGYVAAGLMKKNASLKWAVPIAAALMIAAWWLWPGGTIEAGSLSPEGTTGRRDREVRPRQLPQQVKGHRLPNAQCPFCRHPKRLSRNGRGERICARCRRIYSVRRALLLGPPLPRRAPAMRPHFFRR